MGFDRCFFALYVISKNALDPTASSLVEPIPVDSTILSFMSYIHNLDCVTCDWFLVGMVIQTSCLIVS